MIVKEKLEDCKTVSDFSYTVLKNNILTLRLEPGCKISETEIAESLGISRTPVREALIKLAQEGMVRVQPQRGTFVSKIDLSLVEESRFMRRTLEEKIVSEVVASFSAKDEEDCRRILLLHKQISDDNYEEHFFYDELFHRALYTSAGKGRIWDMIDTFSWDYRRTRYLALLELIKMTSIIQDHEAILDAIVRRDEPGALEATRMHLDRWLKERIPVSSHRAEYFLSPLNAKK